MILLPVVRCVVVRRASAPLGPPWFQDRVWNTCLHTLGPQVLPWWAFLPVLMPLSIMVYAILVRNSWLMLSAFVFGGLLMHVYLEAFAAGRVMAIGPLEYDRVAALTRDTLTGHERMELEAHARRRP